MPPSPPPDPHNATRQFLQLCLRSRCEPAALSAARELAGRDHLDWTALGELLGQQRLAPLFYGIARRQELVPAALEGQLRQAYLANAGRNILLFHELEGLLQQLQAEGIAVLLLKGAALGPAVYGNSALRPLGDVDLLVRREQVESARQLLVAAGYTPLLSQVREGSTVAYENELMLQKAGQVDTLLELHWGLIDSPYYQHHLDLDWFWQTAHPLPIGSATARTLGPEAQLLHLCAHLMLHHGSGEQLSLLWLHDVAETICRYREEIDWDLLLDRARSNDLVLSLQAILPRVVQDWQAPVPEAVRKEILALRASPEEQRVFGWLTAARRPVLQRFWADLASLPTWGRRLDYAWSNVFPSPSYMRDRYGVPHPWLLPLYYPYRWLLGLLGLLGARRR
ncbi:MAG: nucleotidyltransferase family protein [Chloroflexia bacterium]|nr:nucleotidyltransferase family protein [Chloroflexia bacterium]